MDLIKIGKFISEQRKKKGITQEKLAEQLYVTDRAISKWERGLCLPDSGKMLDLCNILGINVNELLNGEKIEMKDYKNKTEELLVELAKQEEINNKRVYTSMYLIYITAFVCYIGICALANYSIKDESLLTIIIVVATVVLCIICMFGFKLEVETGYYECKKCHNKFTTKNYFLALLAPHFGTTRYMKCPKCNKMSWCKKVMTKE